jgi:hypothetical protein
MSGTRWRSAASRDIAAGGQRRARLFDALAQVVQFGGDELHVRQARAHAQAPERPARAPLQRLDAGQEDAGRAMQAVGAVRLEQQAQVGEVKRAADHLLALQAGQEHEVAQRERPQAEIARIEHEIGEAAVEQALARQQ